MGYLKETGAKIRSTVVSALNLASSLGVASVTVPSISGGIFTHKMVPSHPELPERERLTARLELLGVLSAITEWAEGNAESPLRSFVLITKPPGRMQSDQKEWRALIEALRRSLPEPADLPSADAA